MENKPSEHEPRNRDRCLGLVELWSGKYLNSPYVQTEVNKFYNDLPEILGEQAGFVRSIDPIAYLSIYTNDKSDFVIAQNFTTTKKEMLVKKNSDALTHWQSCRSTFYSIT